MGKHSKAANRPVFATGAVLASAAALTITAPEVMPTSAAGASSVRISNAPVELTALSDITVQGINDAYWFGWGGYLTNNDEYYPNVLNNANGGQPIYVSGPSGVLYYVVDNVLDQFNDEIDLDNYYFEIGYLNGGNPNAIYSGASSLIYVGTGQLFGTDSPIFQAVQTVFYYGVTNVINSTIVTLATALVPELTIGPVTVGGGILASLYYYGATPDQSFVANSNGLPAIWSYISTAITGLIPTAAATPAAAAAATPIETVTDSEVHTRPAIGGSKTVSNAGAATAAKETKADLDTLSPITEPAESSSAATDSADATASTDTGGDKSDARSSAGAPTTAADSGPETKGPKHSARGRGHAKPSASR